VIFVMSLLATTTVTDYRITQTNRTSTNHSCASLSPIEVEVVLRSRKWDKENRYLVGSARTTILSRTCAQAEPTSTQKVQLEKNTPFRQLRAG
jgi:hypothetical protein